MTDSFIFGDIIANVGWFDSGPFKKLDDVSFVETLVGDGSIDHDTVIYYFPGSFATFHEGHVSIVESIIQSQVNDNNYVIVISPSNSDYTTEKYGDRSIYATNKFRYDQIVSAVRDIVGNIVIDLNPMLNHDRDYNFTDLLLDFVNRQQIEYSELSNVPFIVCGKDRKNFQLLESLTDKVRIFYGDDVTGSSSSDIIERREVSKKHLLLRVHSRRQYHLFCKYFAEEYLSISPIYISDEILRLVDVGVKHGDALTICKDYAMAMNYIPLHRQYVHPLKQSGHSMTLEEARIVFEDRWVYDSDSYSGSTRRFIESAGAQFICLTDLESDSSKYELLDIMDFVDEYQYPHVDVSSRCSMRPFNKEFHIHFNNFIADLREFV